VGNLLQGAKNEKDTVTSGVIDSNDIYDSGSSRCGCE
jgi:hypothetical protein